MKAIVFDHPGDESVLRIGDAADPEAGPREVRIRVAAAGVNRADLLQRQGSYPPPAGASEILGLECAGIVDAVGEEVHDVDLGADAAIDYRRHNFEEAVRDLTGGRGVDVVLDHIGASYLERNVSSLAVGGKLVVIGGMGGRRAELDLGKMVARRLSIVGSTLRSRGEGEKREIVRAFLGRFGDALRAKRIAPVIDSRFPLAKAGEAHRRMAAGEHFGKIVLLVGR